MKRFVLVFLVCFFSFKGNAQFIRHITGDMYSADVNFGYNLARYKTNYLFEQTIPFSFQLNWHKANYYNQKKLNSFGYSDFGASFLYHDFRDQVLGKNYGLYAFMEYYLLKPAKGFQLSFRLSQGVAYNTNPYDRLNNPKNQLFGSHWLFPFNGAVYMKSPKLFNNWRLQLGFAVFHYSNGNLQSPNYGANIPSITFGLIYDKRQDTVLQKQVINDYSRKWQYTGFLRFGINESDYYDSGQFPFFIPGFQVEKHLSYRHKISVGAELFLSYFLKELIIYEYNSSPELDIEHIADFKRVGIYAGHEFFYDTFGIDISLGYYLYYPYAFETRFYSHITTKLYFNKHWRFTYGLKVHGITRAEAMEFGVMYVIK